MVIPSTGLGLTTNASSMSGCSNFYLRPFCLSVNSCMVRPSLGSEPCCPRSRSEKNKFPEKWLSGRKRSPAKGVWIKSPSRVRIPPSPPNTKAPFWGLFIWRRWLEIPEAFVRLPTTVAAKPRQSWVGRCSEAKAPRRGELAERVHQSLLLRQICEHLRSRINGPQ